MPDLPQKQSRFGECAKFVPVAFVSCSICTLYVIFVSCHLVPGLRSGTNRTLEVAKAVVFHVLTTLLVICYVRSIATHPGDIPDNDPQWEFMPTDSRQPKQKQSASMDALTLNLQETKRSGNRRNCKWCNKFKPDRCHHCRICRTCILKMDHHCPWIYNCVGFKNYKYFFLLLFYSVADLWLIIAYMSVSVRLCALKPDTPFVIMFLTLFGWTLATFLGLLATLFWCFHIWLAAKAMTTVEFCEKHLPKKKGGDKTASYDNSVYNLGLYGNLKATLGDNVFCMLLPLCPPSGNGLDFVNADMRLTKDLEASRSIRRMGHQITQRPLKPLWAAAAAAALIDEHDTEVSLDSGGTHFTNAELDHSGSRESSQGLTIPPGVGGFPGHSRDSGHGLLSAPNRASPSRSGGMMR